MLSLVGVADGLHERGHHRSPNGDVIGRPIRNVDATYGDGYSDEQLEFTKSSRLLIIHGVPGSKSENLSRSLWRLLFRVEK
jgi:hypothetical protein